MLAFSPFRTLTAYMGAATTILCSFDDFTLHVQQYHNFTHCPSAFPTRLPHSATTTRKTALVKISLRE